MKYLKHIFIVTLLALSLVMPVYAGQVMLNFDAQTGSYTPGNTITGATSGATATIFSVHDDGTTGILALTGVSGTFQDDEIIYESALGSELCGNVTFDTDTWWVKSHATITIAGGYGVYTATPQYEQLKRDNFYTINSFYQLDADIVDYASGSLFPDYAGAGTEKSANGSHTWHLQATGVYLRLYAWGGGTSNTFKIDNVSIKQITNAALADGVIYGGGGAKYW